jgi:hypothetical protein
MASSIPYSPALALGNLVSPDVLDTVINISKLQGPIDAAKDTLNALITTRRSLDMTVQELIDLSVSTDDLKPLFAELDDVNKQLVQAAADYGKAVVSGTQPIQLLKSKLNAVNSSVESPVDYNRTEIKKMPLSADSLTMDVQYFSYDQDQQSASNTISDIKGYISDQTSFLGEDVSSSMTAKAGAQLSSQTDNHSVAGTLVITAGCTHKDAVLLAPFILDVDKAVRVWNTFFPDGSDKLDPTDATSLQKIALQSNTADEKSLSLLSGATYGSSFVGMVHVLRQDASSSSQSMTSLAASMQEQFAVGGWFAKESGGFGVDASFSNDIKNLLSSQNVTSHISLITMGSIPSIKSNQVQIGVKTFADFDPAKMMANLATLANATSTDQQSVASSATAAQTGAQMLAIQGSQVQNVMLGLTNLDDGANKILDINSLMTAFEDYVDKALAGNLGVPINYYVKSITKSQLAQMWVAKYYPGKFLAIQGDDSPPAGGGTAPAQNTTGGVTGNDSAGSDTGGGVS